MRKSSKPSGAYILQNTMAREGNKMVPGKKLKNEAVRKKKEKEEKEKGESFFS